MGTVPAKLRASAKKHILLISGTRAMRMKPKYDPPAALVDAKAQLAKLLAPHERLPDEHRVTLDRILESQCRLGDVRAQLALHRRLRRWLVLHIATASALLVLLAFHIVTALTMI